MPRRLTAIITLLFGLIAHAQVRIVADSLYFIDSGGAIQNLTCHLRLKPLKNSDLKYTLFWNYIDSTDYRAAEFTIPAITTFDNTDTHIIPCRILRSDSLGLHIRADYQFPFKYSRGKDAGFSTLLRADTNGARLCVGDHIAVDGIDVAFDRMNTGLMGYRTDKPAIVTDESIIYRTIPARQHFARPILSDGSDHVTGQWRYFDRDADAEKVPGVPDYTIAIVANDDASYTIVYLGDNTSLWSCGDVKGMLNPTQFQNHYNMLWYDAQGREHSTDVFADYLPDLDLLQLSFPLLGTVVRFARVAE